MSKKMLIVVDMQNDFVDGSLANPAAKEIIPLIKERLQKADQNNDCIIFTYDTHFEKTDEEVVGYTDSLEGKFLPIKHCIKDTDSWQIVPELRPWADRAGTVIKKTFGYEYWKTYFANCFDKDAFDKNFPEEIELCGTVTSICVVSNALILRSLYPNTHITVNSKLCADLTPETHEAALMVMKSCQIDVI